MYKSIALNNEPTHTQQIVDWRTGAISHREVTGKPGIAIPTRPTLNIDMNEVARIQKERDEMMIKFAPNAAKMWGLI